ncbi:DUF1311 domain-containing protein [Massilia sp. TW-1]|uniref:DUF1311 domain-containing protein n=1 Tax=Telluria antibiotica TaxID=2717319 RepID=A0ABX0P7M6_9BURK|nr:lysozyme inhibitor LprI family protein [Telluria antibiotica]NIA52950.1 DUF1311 domain-containing protein [Telluria antibiotica]
MTRCAEYHFIERDLDKLVAAQRAWIAFRDRDCDFAASDVEGGSMHR